MRRDNVTTSGVTVTLWSRRREMVPGFGLHGRGRRGRGVRGGRGRRGEVGCRHRGYRDLENPMLRYQRSSVRGLCLETYL